MPLHFLPAGGGLAIQNLPGISGGLAKGPPAVLNALLSADSTLPKAGYKQPLGISLPLEKAPGEAYPLWAFWMEAETVWEPRFGPFEEWRSRLPDSHRGRPLLVVARTQGHWDLPDRFSPELARLLQEKDPLGTPDGRMVVCAAPPAMPLCDSLHSAIGWFLDSMRPSSHEPFPANCLVVRSGCRTVRWGLPFSAAVLACASSQKLVARHPDPPPFRMPLPCGLRVQTNWEGPFLWGAWRTEERAERFLTLGYRAGAAIRGGLSVCMASEERSRALFHGALVSTSGGASIARGTSDGLLERALRAITRNLAESHAVRHAMETPYAELLRTAAPDTLTLHEAASLPAAEPMGPPPEDPEEDGEASGKTFPPDDLCGALQQPREVQMVFPSAKAAARNGAFSALKPVPGRHAGRMKAA